MKMLCFTRSFLLKLALCLGMAALLGASAHAQNLKVEAKLVWGTDDSKSPNPKHHPLDPDFGPTTWQIALSLEKLFQENPTNCGQSRSARQNLKSS